MIGLVIDDNWPRGIWPRSSEDRALRFYRKRRGFDSYRGFNKGISYSGLYVPFAPGKSGFDYQCLHRPREIRCA